VRAFPFVEGLVSLVEHHPHIPDGYGYVLAVRERGLELAFLDLDAAGTVDGTGAPRDPPI
jgi:hypothetical protein